MKMSDVNEKKLDIIEQLLIINDRAVLKKIEMLINDYLNPTKLKRYTKQELINRVKLAEKDIKNGNVVSQKQVEKLSKKW